MGGSAGIERYVFMDQLKNTGGRIVHGLIMGRLKTAGNGSRTRDIDLGKPKKT